MKKNKELVVVVPEGHEIDLEMSDLTSTSGKIVFKPIEPEAWRKGKHRIKGVWISSRSELVNVRSCNEFYSDDPCNRNIFADEKHAKAALAMAQISQIMANDERFGGPITLDEWKDCDIEKHVIEFYCGKISTDYYCDSYYFLAFHTDEQRDLFLEENRDLVEQYFML